MSDPTDPRLWRQATTPVAAHDLALVCAGDVRYAHARGVAQQAARLVRRAGLARGPRSELLCAAWLSWLGIGIRSLTEDMTGPRMLRGAGHEQLARIVAWSGAGGVVCDGRGSHRLVDEFPVPTKDSAQALLLLDVALVSTDAAGALATPTAVLRGYVDRYGPKDPRVIAFVGLVADLADHPDGRAMLEVLAAQAVGGSS